MEQQADELLYILDSHGFPSYKVGGYVRDKLLGRRTYDIDIATPASPEQVLTIFPHSIPTGIKHGTVTVPYGSYLFEVTTFRVDKDYHDHRHPSRVEFVDRIEEDLSRRDFTINAMAMDRFGHIIDPYGGKGDLERGLIRAVGNPTERLNEDALRILRGIRFAARFNFLIEPSTWHAMTINGELLVHIAKERIRTEWQKTIETNEAIDGIKLLGAKGILPFPEWRAMFSAVPGHAIRSLIEEQQEPALRWAVILCLGPYEAARILLTEWKFPKAIIQEIMSYIDLVFIPLESTLRIKRLLVEYGMQKLASAFRIRFLMGDFSVPSSEQLTKWFEEISIRDLKDLAINGKDILGAMDKPPGSWVGTTLQHLFNMVAFLGLENNPEILLQEARKVNGDEK